MISFGGKPVNAFGLGALLYPIVMPKQPAQSPQGRWVLWAGAPMPRGIRWTGNRGYGAGRTWMRAGRGTLGIRYYYWAPNSFAFADRFGLGSTTDDALDGAAQAVIGMDTPCTMDGTVASFQTAWNNTTDSSLGSPALAVDDKYGPMTSAALTRVVGGNAPGSCPQYLPAPKPLPAPAPPSPTPGPVIPPTTRPTGGGAGPLIAGGLLVAGGVAATAYALKRYRRRHAT